MALTKWNFTSVQLCRYSSSVCDLHSKSIPCSFKDSLETRALYCCIIRWSGSTMTAWIWQLLFRSCINNLLSISPTKGNSPKYIIKLTYMKGMTIFLFFSVAQTRVQLEFPVCVTCDLTINLNKFDLWLDFGKFDLRLDLTWEKITWLQHCLFDRNYLTLLFVI